MCGCVRVFKICMCMCVWNCAHFIQNIHVCIYAVFDSTIEAIKHVQTNIHTDKLETQRKIKRATRVTRHKPTGLYQLTYTLAHTHTERLMADKS